MTSNTCRDRKDVGRGILSWERNSLLDILYFMCLIQVQAQTSRKPDLKSVSSGKIKSTSKGHKSHKTAWDKLEDVLEDTVFPASPWVFIKKKAGHGRNSDMKFKNRNFEAVALGPGRPWETLH